MFPFAVIIFLVIPVVEIYFLIQVSEQIGALWTVLLVVLTAVIGVRLLKQQGLSTLMKAQKKMQSGSLPAVEMVEGIALVIAGAFLLTPGFFTDAFGFLLLFPVTRKAAVALFAVKAAEHMKNSGFSTMNPGINPNAQSQDPFGQQNNTKPSQSGTIIDGVKYHEEKED